MDREQEHLETLRHYKEKVERFLGSEEWKWLKGIIDNQIYLRRNVIFQHEMKGLDDCFKLAQMRGEVAGLQFLEAYLVASLEELKREIKQEMEKEHAGDDNDYDDLRG